MTTPDLRCLSLGAGVQSTAMYLMADEGLITPLPEIAVFADTQCEPNYVYETLQWLENNFSKIPIIRATAGSLLEAVGKASNAEEGRFASVPFWVEGEDGREAPGRRQCTREFKIDVVKKAIRTHLGLKPRDRIAGVYEVEQWVGISMDEVQRAKPSRDSWSTSRWPFLYDLPMRRGEIIEWMEEKGYPVPSKSACSFCPWRNIQEWRRLRAEDPEAFTEAVGVDKMIRERGPMKGMKKLQYVHRSLRPLIEVVDDPRYDDEQIDLFGNECEGMCGV